MGWELIYTGPPQCDECGKFVSFADIESGAATLQMRQEWYTSMSGEPDMDEVFDCLCPTHMEVQDGQGKDT